ncbi:MAG TPA: AMP-binding protein [Acidimicrobiales bacterium]|jgi:acyl-CoA synthetase (AMP-forming)/AMP-acid ligase II|nr:AMP-binding protein [Acidimicrobiales bacterium]
MGLDWQPRAVPPELASAYRREGFWGDESLGALLCGRLAARPEQTFKLRSDVRPWTGTFGDVLDGSRQVAAGLAATGVGPGDVVAFQLPNWVEAALLFYGASLLGAVVVPIVHFYGAKEVRYILDRSGARVLVTADQFRGIDYLASLDTFVADLAALEQVFVVGSNAGRWTPFSKLLSSSSSDAASPLSPATVDPASAALVGWTSGTTAEPKGVVHSHRSIVAEARQLAGARSGPPTLIGAPVGHAIGLLGGLIIPVLDGLPVQLIDTWDPGVVLAAMLEDKVSAATGATFFLTSLLDHPDFGPDHVELMQVATMGGAPVPRAVADRTTALGMSMIRMYGSTEHPSTTGSVHRVDPPEKGMFTDGRPLPGVELRLVDEDGRDVDVGVAGEILSRGPDCFEGYTDPALTADAFVDDGWYVTGDVGVLDPDGYLTITDRKKDIIIRGGENVSAAEVEELLLRMPGVAEVAVVAAPDRRLGEHACAFVRMLPGASGLDLPAVQSHLLAAGLARQKCPEELRAVPDFPRTASGKVQKFVLRQQLREGS